LESNVGSVKNTRPAKKGDTTDDIKEWIVGNVKDYSELKRTAEDLETLRT